MPSLKDRVQEFTHLLADIAMDGEGIVRCALWADGPRVLRPGDLRQAHLLAEKDAPEAFHAYEDAGMATGAFLAAQSRRFRATGDQEALRLARRAFGGLRRIYDLGREREPGFFPKPYGARCSDQISRDQCLFALNGLLAYRDLADQGEGEALREMAAGIGGFWVNNRYMNSYFGLPASNHLKDYMGPLFLGLIRIAATLSGEERLQAEYERLIAEEKLDRRLADETLRGLFREGVTYDGGMYFRQNENPLMMKSMAADHLWDAEPARRACWRRALETMRDDDLGFELNREAGTTFAVVGYDREKDSVVVTEPGVLPDLENPLNLPFLTWGGRRLTPGGAQVACAAAIIASRLEDPQPAALGREVLEKMTLDLFRRYTLTVSADLPPGDEDKTVLFSAGHVAYWLQAYWLGRERGLWGE